MAEVARRAGGGATQRRGVRVCARPNLQHVAEVSARELSARRVAADGRAKLVLRGGEIAAAVAVEDAQVGVCLGIFGLEPHLEGSVAVSRRTGGGARWVGARCAWEDATPLFRCRHASVRRANLPRSHSTGSRLRMLRCRSRRGRASSPDSTRVARYNRDLSPSQRDTPPLRRRIFWHCTAHRRAR